MSYLTNNRYLLTGKAEFFIFDDKDSSGDFCFGTASVPLKELVRYNSYLQIQLRIYILQNRDKTIEGPFPIIDQQGHQNGTIQVHLFNCISSHINLLYKIEIYWRIPYKRPAVHGLPPRRPSKSITSEFDLHVTNDNYPTTDRLETDKGPKSDRSDKTPLSG